MRGFGDKVDVPRPVILKRLRTETQALHTSLEDGLPLMSPTLSRGEYRALLERFLGYYGPLENELLAKVEPERVGLDYRQRLKVPGLKKDLVLLGLTPEEIDRLPCCGDLPRLDSTAAVLGCLYVIEGATLGGQVITRHLGKHLEITPETGGAFFAGYGGETGPRWKEFGEILTASAAREENDDAIVQAANDTFETMALWLFRKTRY